MLPPRLAGTSRKILQLDRTTQMRTSEGPLFRACYSKGGGRDDLHLAETHRQAGKFENCVVGKEKVPGRPR